MPLRISALVILSILALPINSNAETVVNDFEDCMMAGGSTTEIWPRECYINGEYFSEEASEVNKIFQFREIVLKGAKASVKEIDDCTRAGGVIKAVGKLQFEKCVQDYPDAGKECKDGSDCLGNCILDADLPKPEIGAKATGICEEDNIPFGCISLVNDGVFEGTLCID